MSFVKWNEGAGHTKSAPDASRMNSSQTRQDKAGRKISSRSMDQPFPLLPERANRLTLPGDSEKSSKYEIED